MQRSIYMLRASLWEHMRFGFVLFTLLLLSAVSVSADSQALEFARHVFRDLGENGGNVTETVIRNQAAFDSLDLGDQLSSLFEMRIADLKLSLEHTLKMQEVISELAVHSLTGLGLIAELGA